jgi:ABC-2 type transport system permease protein
VRRSFGADGVTYRSGVRAIWEHRQVLRMLVLRDLQKIYTRFRLGYVWTLLEPLGMTLVLWFVFSQLLGRQLGLQPYLLFLSVAILPWWWFTNGMHGATKAFRNSGGALRISLLPTQLWVVRVVLVSMVEFLFSLPVVLIAMAITRTLPGPEIALFPVAILIQLVFMYGLGLLIASVCAVIPDAARLVRILLRTMFYLSPVLYSVSNIPQHLQNYAGLNPLVGIFGLYRIGWWPDELESVGPFAISLGVCAVLLIAGIVVFRRLEGRLLKEV